MKDMIPGSKWNQTDKHFTDISSEILRQYTFPNKDFVIINAPTHLHVSETGGHRILDAEGISHYIPPGWIHLEWEVKEDHPHFVA